MSNSIPIALEHDTTELCPEQHLAMAVIDRAIQDLKIDKPAGSVLRQELERIISEAYRWLFVDQRGDLEWYCQIVDMSADRLRKQIHAGLRDHPNYHWATQQFSQRETAKPDETRPPMRARRPAANLTVV